MKNKKFAISGLKIQLRLKNDFRPVMIWFDLGREVHKIEFFKETEVAQVHFSWKLWNLIFGAVHKRRRNFLVVFDTAFPHVGTLTLTYPASTF